MFKLSKVSGNAFNLDLSQVVTKVALYTDAQYRDIPIRFDESLPNNTIWQWTDDDRVYLGREPGRYVTGQEIAEQLQAADVSMARILDELT